MRQQLHPNVLPLYTSFVHEQNLWMVMPYVSSGSVLNIIKYAHPEVKPHDATATLLNPARCLSPLCLAALWHSLAVFSAAVSLCGALMATGICVCKYQEGRYGAGFGRGSDCNHPEGGSERP